MMKPLMTLNQVCVDYPLLGHSQRMLKNVIVDTLVGGRIHHKSKLMVRALENINLTISPGEAIGLAGPNGSGKSTLLGVISGVFKPSSGEIISSARISSLLNLNMGMLDEATGVENTEIYAGIHFMPRYKRKKFINVVTEFSGLKSYMKMPVRTFSSGMRLRLAFSLAILIEPDVLILDEIIAVADEEFRNEMFYNMKQFIQQKKALVMAIHNQSIMHHICNKFVHLKNGLLIT